MDERVVERAGEAEGTAVWAEVFGASHDEFVGSDCVGGVSPVGSGLFLPEEIGDGG